MWSREGNRPSQLTCLHSYTYSMSGAPLLFRKRPLQDSPDQRHRWWYAFQSVSLLQMINLFWSFFLAKRQRLMAAAGRGLGRKNLRVLRWCQTPPLLGRGGKIAPLACISLAAHQASFHLLPSSLQNRLNLPSKLKKRPQKWTLFENPSS